MGKPLGCCSVNGAGRVEVAVLMRQLTACIHGIPGFTGAIRLALAAGALTIFVSSSRRVTHLGRQG